MEEDREKIVVLIEDEPSDAGIIRSQLEEAFKSKNLKIKILPQVESVHEPLSYESMEKFVNSPDGKKGPDLQAFMIVDLFLAKDLETPNIVFHQLMSTFFTSPIPNDLSLVCGRIGVLAKLREYYKKAYLEVFSYFPTYFDQQNERVEEEEECLHSEYSIKQLKNFVKKAGPEKLEEFISQNREIKDESTAVNFLQIRAMKDALCERLNGIFKSKDALNHITDIVSKTNQLSKGIDELINKIDAWYKKEQ